MTDPIPELPRESKRGPPRTGLIVVAALAGAGVGLAAVYGVGGIKRQGTGGAAPARARRRRGGAPLGAARARRGRRVNAESKPAAAARSRVSRRRRQGGEAFRFPRPHGAPQPVGTGVRALPHENAGAAFARAPSRR